MKILKYTVFFILGVVALVLLAGLVLPRDFTVERSTVVKASEQVVQQQLVSLRNRQAWSPWAAYDPNMTVTYTGTDGEVGSASQWSGNEKVGKGKQEITSISAGRVDTKLAFIEPWESQSTSYFLYSPVADGISVTWGLKGSSPYPFNALSLLMNMDKLIGQDFEKGLSNLKQVCEQAN